MKLSVLTNLLPALALSMQTTETLKDKTFEVKGVRVFDEPEIDHIDDVDDTNANNTQIVLQEKGGVLRLGLNIRNFIQLVTVDGPATKRKEGQMVEVIAEMSKGSDKVVLPAEITVDDVTTLQAKNVKGELKDVYPQSAFKKYRDALAKAEKAWDLLDKATQEKRSPYQLVYSENRGLRASLLDLKPDPNTEVMKEVKVRYA